MNSSVQVILVNYRNMAKTVACIHALEKMSVKPRCIYLIDNASTEESRKEYEQAFPGNSSGSFGIHFICNEKNIGFAAACNQGIRAARKADPKSYVWLLNNDTLPDEKALEKLIETASSEKTGITGSHIQNANGKFSGGVGFIHPWFASVRRPHSIEEKGFDYIEGSSFLISPDCLDTVGLLSEDYFLYFEESDYCIRAKKRGFKMGWATDSVIKHDIGTSTGSERGKGGVPFFIDCLMVRNRLHFAKICGYPASGRFAGLCISLLLRIKRLQWNRVLKIMQITLSTNAFKKFIEVHGGAYEIHT